MYPVMNKREDEIISELGKNPELLTKQDSTMFFFGQNKARICFATDKVALFRPVGMKFWNNPKFIQVAAEANHAAAIDTNGDLYQWGSGYFGDEGANESQYEVTLINKKLELLDINSKLVAGLNRKGEVYLVDSSQQLQKSKTYEQPSSQRPFFAKLFGPKDEKTQFKSYRMPFVLGKFGNNEKFTKMCVGEEHILLLTNKGNLFTGSLTDSGNLVGQLGKGPSEDTVKLKPLQTTSTSQTSNTHYDYQSDYIGERIRNSKMSEKIVVSQVPTEFPVKDIACGSYHSVILDTNGSVFSFGYNDFLQCGIGPFHPESHFVTVPTKLNIIVENDQKITNIYAKYKNTILKATNQTTKQNSFYACGAGLDGQIGTGSFSHANGTPILVKFLEAKRYYDEKRQKETLISFDNVSIGNGHLGAILKTSVYNKQAPDTLFLWGKNSSGQLGNETKIPVAEPKSTFLLNPKELSKIFCGNESTIVY